MLLEQTQRDHDEAAHDRLAAIRAILKCEIGEEAARVEHLHRQYTLVHEALDRVERQAAEDEAEQIGQFVGAIHFDADVDLTFGGTRR